MPDVVLILLTVAGALFTAMFAKATLRYQKRVDQRANMRNVTPVDMAPSVRPDQINTRPPAQAGHSVDTPENQLELLHH